MEGFLAFLKVYRFKIGEKIPQKLGRTVLITRGLLMAYTIGQYLTFSIIGHRYRQTIGLFFYISIFDLEK